MTNNKRNIKLKRLLIGAAILFFFLGIAYMHFLLPLQMLRVKNFDTNEYPEQFGRGLLPAPYGIKNATAVQIPIHTTVVLEGYYIPATTPSTGQTIIAVHDFFSCKEHLYSLASWAQSEGFHVLIYDQRAQGKSDGAFCTYGAKEAEDILIIAQWLEKQYQATEIGLWGKGMGSLSIMEALSMSQQFQFAILENTYLSSKAIFEKQSPLFQWGILLDYCFDRASAIGDFTPVALQDEKYSAIETPILLIHGKKNQRIPINKVEQVQKRQLERVSELIIIEGANHYNTWHLGREELEKQFQKFLHKQT